MNCNQKDTWKVEFGPCGDTAPNSLPFTNRFHKVELSILLCWPYISCIQQTTCQQNCPLQVCFFPASGM